MQAACISGFAAKMIQIVSFSKKRWMFLIHALLEVQKNSSQWHQNQGCCAK